MTLDHYHVGWNDEIYRCTSRVNTAATMLSLLAARSVMDLEDMCRSPYGPCGDCGWCRKSQQVAEQSRENLLLPETRLILRFGGQTSFEFDWGVTAPGPGFAFWAATVTSTPYYGCVQRVNQARPLPRVTAPKRVTRVT